MLEEGMTKYECGGGCGIHVIRPNGPLSFCSACFYLAETLRREDCSTVAELRDRRHATLARVSDLLIRTGVDDAPRLIRLLEKL